MVFVPYSDSIDILWSIDPYRGHPERTGCLDTLGREEKL